MAKNLDSANILMIVENMFPQDMRVRNEAASLADCRYGVSIICLRGEAQKYFEKWNDISVYRIPYITVFKKKATKGGPNRLYNLLSLLRGVLGYSTEYIYFTGISFILSLFVCVREGFNVVHVHNPPDTLFLIGAFYKMFGKNFVFDQHDLAPDMYLAKYGSNHGLAHRILILLERLSCQVADKVIVTNESYKSITAARNKIPRPKVEIVRNGPGRDLIDFEPSESQITHSGRQILVYVGALNSQDGGFELLRVLKALVYELKVKGFLCSIVGDGETLGQLKSYAGQFGLDEHILFTGPLDQERVYEIIYAADICLSSEPLNEYNDNSSFTKIVEYMALGKPIVAFDLKETRFTAQEAALYVRPNDELEFARAIKRLMDNAELRARIGPIGRKRIEEELSWLHISKNLIKAYETIHNRRI